MIPIEDFEFVAIIYAGFQCDKCPAYYAVGKDDSEIARNAQQQGWFVDIEKPDARILCPECKE